MGDHMTDLSELDLAAHCYRSAQGPEAASMAYSHLLRLMTVLANENMHLFIRASVAERELEALKHG
jgi:hypothetical protein